MGSYACPNCCRYLVPYCNRVDDEPYFGDDGEYVYCSACEFTSSEILFIGEANEQEKKDKLSSQMEANKLHNDSLVWS